MITNDGKAHIKRYMAGLVPSIGEALALGIGASAEDAADVALDFEVGRVDVELVSYDFTADLLIFKATIPQEFAGTIYEVGLWSTSSDSRAGSYTSEVLTSFDSETELWTGGSYATANNRVGIDSLRLAPSASTSANATMSELEMDLSGYSGVDQFSIAYNSGGTTPTSITVDFKNDSSNYYRWSVTPGAGYQFVTVNKSTLTATGSPNWGAISTIEVTVNAAAGGAAQIDFDAIRINDTDTLNPDYALVAREVLPTPYVKTEGEVQDIEFSVPVSIA